MALELKSKSEPKDRRRNKVWLGTEGPRVDLIQGPRIQGIPGIGLDSLNSFGNKNTLTETLGRLASQSKRSARE